LAVGGTMPSRIAITQAISSSAPDAPRQWACIDLVEEIESLWAWSPKTRLIAAVSIWSLALVPVPCALI
jgi:hypothetical protein